MDSELNSLLLKFCELASSVRCSSAEEVRGAFNAGRFLVHKNVVFAPTDQVSIVLSKVVRRCEKVLGPRLAHEDDIRQLAWDVAAGQFGDASAASAHFLKGIKEFQQKSHLLILPNYTIDLKTSVQGLTIGPVYLCRGKEILDLINAKTTSRLNAAIGEHGSVKVEGDKLLLGVADVCWQVQVAAAQRNAYEEAAWLVDIALSVLRLSYTRHTPLYPAVGEIEAHPTDRLQSHNLAITKNADGIQAGGLRIPLHYTVDDGTLKRIRAPNFAKKVAVLFDAPRTSLAVRFAHGLGWMSRARRSLDRSERLLFFFTAIEALLSTEDKTAPVVQTIARHAATILAQPKQRSRLARDIKRSYEIRSALIHAGRREVSHSEARDAHLLAEALYSRVWKMERLERPAVDFHTDLSEASYGLSWPLRSRVKRSS